MKKFEIGNIDSYFSETIIRRGYDYYRSGRIVGCGYFDDNCVQLEVRGRNYYYCTIKIIDKDTFEMECNCPVANIWLLHYFI